MMKPSYEQHITKKFDKKSILKYPKFLFLGFILFLTYLPIVVIAISSVNKDANGVTWGGFTLEWFTGMFADSNLMEAIGWTLIIAVLSTIISTLLGTITAIGIHGMSKKAKKALIFLNNVPIINADIVTGVFLLIIFNVCGAVIGQKYVLGFPTLLIAHVLFSTPYVILSILPKLSELDENLFDAALDLGCRPYYALRKIILPSIKSGILVGMFFAFTMSIDDFVISYFVSGAEIKNFSIWLYGSLRITKNHPWPKACAYNTIVTFVTIIGLVMYNIFGSKKRKEKRK